MFKGNVTIKRLEVQLWELVGDLRYTNGTLFVIAKSGLKTDGASVPRVFWRAIGSPFVGDYVCSAIIHDALYMSEAMTRKDADDLFLEMMKVEGVSYWKRYAMYWAVRAGGGFVWKKHTPESIEEGRRYCEVVTFNDCPTV